METIKKYQIVIVLTMVALAYIKPPLCFVLTGSITFYLGLTSIKLLKKLRISGIERTGKITEIVENSDGHKMPFIEFTAMTGEAIKGKPFVFTTTNSSILKTNKYQPNQSVQIVYDADEPKKFVLSNEEASNDLVFKIFMIVGLLFIGLGICWLLGYIKF